MNHRCCWIFPLVGLALSSCDGLKEKEVPVTAPPLGESAVSFEVDIKPILGEACVNCHNRELMPERVSFEKKAWAMQPMGGSPVIIPGLPENSRMITAVSGPDTADRAMPPVGHRITSEQLDLLTRWIAEGAHWPSGHEGEIQPMEIPME